MATLTVNGRKITVDDSFLKLSHADQERTVNEIVAKLPAGPQTAPGRTPQESALLQAHATMPRSQPPTPQQQVDSAIEAFRMADHPEMTVPNYTKQFNESGMSAPLNLQQLAQNDQMFGFGDEISGLAGGTAAAMAGKDFGKNYDAAQRLQEARRALALQQGGIPAAAASAVGSLTSLGAAAPAAAATAPASLLGRVGQFAKDTGTGATTGAVLGGVQGFGEANGDLDNRLQGAQQGAEVGGAFGAAAPTVIRTVTAPFRGAAQNAAVNAAIKNAPSAADLGAAATQMFREAKSSGVGVKPEKFSQTVADLIQSVKARDIDPDLDGAAVTVYRRAAELAQQGAADPSALSLSRLHNLRQKAQDVVMDPASKNRTKQFAQDLVDGIDNMISGLKPGDLTGIPTNRLGKGYNPNAAGNALLDGIATWAKAKKVGLLESAMRSAENYASGLESGLRAQFKTLLNGAKTKNLWTPVERKAMQEVIGGNLTVRALRALGIFKGFASAGVGGGLGSLLGPWGTAAGTALGGAAGVGARAITEAAAASSANRAARIVATPGVPSAPIQLPRFSGTTFPLLQGQTQPQ